MKGIIFNLAEGVVRDEMGDDMWDDVLERAGLDGSYTALGTYADAELEMLGGALSDLTGASVSDLMRHVGRRGLRAMAGRYPEFFEPFDNSRSLLLGLNSMVHPEVRRLFPGAEIPELEHRQVSDRQLDLAYVSSRGRCDLAEGLVLGAGDHFGEVITVTQTSCTHRGDPQCVLQVTWS